MRFRITQIIVIEYEVNPDHYKDKDGNIPTPEEMIEIDLMNFRDDPPGFGLIQPEDFTKFEVTGKIIW